MFTLRGRNPFGCPGVSCVKLPATVEFPTDEGLLRRIEASRRALPQNSMKALRWKRASKLKLASSGRAALDELYVGDVPRWTLPKTVYVEDVYARSRAAI